MRSISLNFLEFGERCEPSEKNLLYSKEQHNILNDKFKRIVDGNLFTCIHCSLYFLFHPVWVLCVPWNSREDLSCALCILNVRLLLSLCSKEWSSLSTKSSQVLGNCVFKNIHHLSVNKVKQHWELWYFLNWRIMYSYFLCDDFDWSSYIKLKCTDILTYIYKMLFNFYLFIFK